ncbi:cytochrome c5 family protein [Ahniella affigens]|uniref:Cytochrome c5 family protein n=1 Tax=Ahniella affigens TaxID=2021234 RepID=A0A2P1PMF3_9GAMM|nr:c-type cytochrome [Ahniella affigens]AVP96024.1 cytochrome c5 family protein [Ahniella affigens]
MTPYDLQFMKRFALIIAALMALTVVLIVAAHHIYGKQEREPNAAIAAQVGERISPIGAVYAGATGDAALALAQQRAAEAAKAQVAYDGTLDGGVIYGKLCTTCHTGGVAGAPKLEKAAWAARIAQGNDTLYTHAIGGFAGAAGNMPARGGNPSLTDDQVKATVDWMLANLQ